MGPRGARVDTFGMAIRVLIADGHHAVREAVRAMLALEQDVEIAGEAADGETALGLARELRPNLVVLDASMPALSGLEVSRTVAAELPDTGVVFLTLDPALRDLALAGGALAYVLKDGPPEEFLRAIRATTAALKARRLPLDVSRAYGVVIITAASGEGVLAMADPLDEKAHEDAERASGLRLSRVTATHNDIADALERAWTGATPTTLPYRIVGAWRSLALALVLIALPILAIVAIFRDGLAPDRIFALLALLCGFFFFAYALKYYITSAAVLAIALLGDSLVLGKKKAQANGRAKGGSGPEHKEGYKTLRGEKLDEAGAVLADATPIIGQSRLPIARQPFVSVQVALYNEARVVDRLLAACTSFDYENYEVIVADDSTDETVEILQRWRNHPRVKILHRTNRKGFKGGALQEALRRMNSRAEYVMIFDADFIPPADAIWHFLDYFGRLSTNTAPVKTNGNGHTNSKNGVPQNCDRLAAVQGYQWHMLNASENWVTKGVRAEFAGSYVLERAGQELFGTMKMISGSVYMIRADVLRKLGWSTSITEDWELSIRLYLAGYKVLYTPYIQAPAECVS